MKKKFLVTVLALSLCLSICGIASAAAYVPEDITYQNLNGQQQAIKVFNLAPDQDPADLVEPDFEYAGYIYSYSSMTKQEQTFEEEKTHTETVTVETKSKDLSTILAELEPTMEYDDGTSKGTLALDHESLKTEAAGYKTSKYTVTATKNYTGLDRNDSSYIDQTMTKNGRTLTLSNISWSVESTALAGDELVPATYSAVATYSGTASSSVATGYITTVDYVGTVKASGVSGITYTVIYVGVPVVIETPEPVEPEPPDHSLSPGAFTPVLLGIGSVCAVLFLILLLYTLLFRSNTTVYGMTDNDGEYEKYGRLRLNVRNPKLCIDKMKNAPSGDIAIEVEERTARKLINEWIDVRYHGRRFSHKVGEVEGPYWFRLNIDPNPNGFQENEEDPV